MIRRFHHGLIACLVVLAAMLAGIASAALPQTLNHQGRIAVEGVNFDGNGQFKFALVNANGTATYWSNDGTSVGGAAPAAAVNLTVSKGLYAVLLGNTALANMTAIPPSALEQEDVRLRVWFNDGPHEFQQITPDQRLAAVPYAIHAGKALAAGSFSGNLSGDVTGAQNATAIADATVTAKLLTGFASGNGSLTAADSILSAIGKLQGIKAPLDSPSFTGTVSGITPAMVGLGNVTNTSDSSKPISTAQQAALDLKAPLASPTFTGTVNGITAGMVGLGNVTNTSDASKPVSTVQQAALDLKAPLESPTFTGTVNGITAGMVGLGNVTNTSDASKPVSTAQQAALDLKAPLASPTFTGAVAFSAGTTTTAPIRLAAGTSLTTPVAGAVEFDGSQLYLTTSPATRKTLAFADAAGGAIAAERLIAAPVAPVIAWGSNSDSQSTVPALSNVGSIAAGGLHSLALLKNGTVQAWGGNASGQTNVPAGALSGVAKIAAGFAHNVVCKTDGTLVAWGDSSYGRTTIPGGITTATGVAAGSLHSLALLSNGTVRTWGDSTFGQSTVPGNLTAVTAIAAGEFHSLALKSNGQVVAWGSNSTGQTAIPAAASSGVTAIAAGWNHNLALTTNGSVLAWGLNTANQTNVPAAASSGVVQIAAGDTFSLALKSDGTVIVWGFAAVENPVTTVPAGATQVAQIAAGASHALALRSDTVSVQFARLDAAGRLGIGRTPATNALEVEGDASKSSAGNWLANSDRRIKTDIQPITGALETLARVRLVDFRYTPSYLAAHPAIEDRYYPNVIAQEFAEVFPDDVKSSGETLPDGSPILQVDTYPLTIYTAAAVQELQRENEALKKQVADQELRLRKLEEAVR